MKNLFKVLALAGLLALGGCYVDGGIGHHGGGWGHYHH